MKITYEGFYGFQNTGDDAFIEVCAWGARKYWNCEHNSFFGKLLPQTVFPINKKRVSIGKGIDRAVLIRELSNSDYYISAGGSTFMEIPFHSNKAVGRHYKKMKKNLHLGGIGVSIGPFNNIQDEKAVIKYLKACDFLALRDSRSYNYAKSLDLPYEPVHAFDLAALLPLVYANIPRSSVINGKKVVGISVCLYESFVHGDIIQEQKRISFFKELVELINKHCDVHFKVFIINGNKKRKERAVSEDLMENIEEDRISIVPYSPTVHKTWQEIASCDVMISTRLHAAIFACYAEVPFFLIEYHKKCTDFLEDVGQNEIYRMYDAGIRPAEILPIILKVLEGTYTAPKNIAKTVEMAALNFTQTVKI